MKGIRRLGLAIVIALAASAVPASVLADSSVGGSFQVGNLLAISDVQASAITTSSATISWATNAPATSQVFYDTQPHDNAADYAHQTTELLTLVSEHSVGLFGLSSSTVYHYRVRSVGTVDDIVFTAISDDYTFTTIPWINVSVPSGVESWQAGSKQTISWTYAGNLTGYVKIELLKGGVLSRTLTSSARIGTGGQGSYSWSIPITQAGGDDYAIRVTSRTATDCTDTSAEFTIIGPIITVSAPAGDEIWNAGTSHTISWVYTGSLTGYVKIELLKGGVLSRTLATSARVGSGGQGSFNWTISPIQAGGDDYTIRVTSRVAPDCTDTSAEFTIIGPTIAVTLPEGDESWQAGTNHAISWTYTGSLTGYVKIELLKGGVLSRTITTSARVGSVGHGSYSWTISTIQAGGSDYAIRVTSRTAPDCTDTSAEFTIIGPTITVTLPEGDESWQAGTNHAISWTYTGSLTGYVKIELLKGGVLSRTITTSARVGSVGHGSYSWTISTIQAGGSDYAIRVTSRTAPDCTDTSAGFTIIGPVLTVTAPNGGESWAAGSGHTLSWTYTGSLTGYARIELLKGGLVSRTITSNARIGTGGQGSYSWTVPSAQVGGTDYTIRVTSRTATDCTDVSDGSFTITH